MLLMFTFLWHSFCYKSIYKIVHRFRGRDSDKTVDSFEHCYIMPIYLYMYVIYIYLLVYMYVSLTYNE